MATALACIVCKTTEDLKYCMCCNLTIYCGLKCQLIDRNNHMTMLARRQNVKLATQQMIMIGELATFEINVNKIPFKKDEDRFIIKMNDETQIIAVQGKQSYTHTEAFDDCNAFAVFDGHGGRQTSSFLQEKSLNVFFNSRVFKNGRIRNRSIVSNERIDDIFHEWDRSLLNIDIGHSGATGNIVLVDEDSIKIAYVGDSRSIIYIPGKKDAVEKQNQEDNILVSADHKVTDLKERERVKRKGGTIAVNSNFLIANKDIMLDKNQPEKVTSKKQYQDFIDEGDKKQVISSDGSFHAHIVLRVSVPSHETALAMSRSFGDLRLKRDLTAETSDPKYKYDGEGILSCKPTIGEIKIPNEENMDIYIVVASDGFWDYVLDNQEIITIIQREKTLPKIRDALKKKVVNQHDDTTILVVHLKTKKQK